MVSRFNYLFFFTIVMKAGPVSVSLDLLEAFDTLDDKMSEDTDMKDSINSWHSYLFSE